MPDIRTHVEEAWPHPLGMARHIAACAEPLPEPDDPAFGRLFDRFGDARVVLLGSAAQGSSEFCRARAAITRWLVERRGFNIVALEADWPDARTLDARAHEPRARAADRRLATGAWAWRSREFAEFLAWLACRNAGLPRGARAGIYGLDLFGLDGALDAVVTRLERADPHAAEIARERFGCPTPWVQEPAALGRIGLSGRYASCEGDVTAMLRDRLDRQFREAARDDYSLLDPAHMADVVRGAETHYRAMYYGGGEAWNLRSRHMIETLKALLAARGPDARAVVWAHNAQAGDARGAEMGHVRDEVNLGQLARETWGEQARLIGLGTHAGEVACVDDAGGPVEIRALRPSLPESHERQAHNTGVDRFLLDLRPGVHSALRRALAEPRLQRLVGAAYRPETERWSHYAEARLPEQFDAWVWFNQTTPLALQPEPATA